MRLKNFLVVLLAVFCLSFSFIPVVYADEDTTGSSDGYYTNTEPQTEYTEPTDAPTNEPVPTEPVTEPQTDYTEPAAEGTINYEPPATEAETQPSALFPIEEDKPTNPRIDSEEDTTGNIVIGGALWIFIAVGIIIVSGIVIATHRRKKL